MSVDIRHGRAVLGVCWCGWLVAVVAVTVAVTFAEVKLANSTFPKVGRHRHQ
jgi:hypothetical protein